MTFDRLDDELLDTGRRGRLAPKAALEGVERPPGAERLDRHAAGMVPDPSGEARLHRQPVDPGAKAHALDGAADPDPPPVDADRVLRARGHR